MRTISIVLAGVVTMVLQGGAAETPQERLVREFMTAGGVPGVVVAVVKSDSVLYRQAFGVSDLRRGTPMTLRTCMELGSIAKAFTAEVIIDLHDRRLLDLADPITRHLRGAPASWSGITIDHLLTHTSGIQNYLLDPRFRAETYFLPAAGDDPLEGVLEGISTDSLVRLFYSLPLEFAPGWTWSYSNTGYFLLGKIAESVTREPFFAYATANLTAPLGMRQTKVCEASWKEGCLARGYVPTAGGPRPARVLTGDYAFSAGAWAVSGEDMIAYMKAVHRRALPSDRAGFNWKLRAPYPGHPFQYYGGRFFSTYHGKHISAHNGGTPGFSSSWMYVEEDSISIVVLANRQDYAPIDRLAWDLLAHYLPALRYPTQQVESHEGAKWGEVVAAAIDSLQANRPLPPACSEPLRGYMESDNGRGLWHWYFARGFPTAIRCVDAEISDGFRMFRYLLNAPGGVEYRLTAVVNGANELVRLFW